ncbi:hypothetical protein FNW17_11005 [Flavobacterium franklandianum]|uniref:Uncharacterized protein n=2 Tax=Flavobacterium franklandianum TaxID=2594430 RepID=A0A553CJM0_9FLAO|nr:hypothetical protein FNW17_11005 [Flavobacterium franklandianum]
MLLKPILPVLEYVVNYEYISKVLCINKAKPKMQCNGKCHLMKEMAKASEKEAPISSDKKMAPQQIEVLFFQEIKSFKIASIYFYNKQNINSNYSNLYYYLNSASVFHPPTFIS